MAKTAKEAAPAASAAPDQGNLLVEPLIGVADIRGARTSLTLPQVFARLSDPAQTTVAFTALQAHQSHAWHAFLVQVAAMAMHRAGESAPWTAPERWGEALLRLAAGSASAWTLVVGDLGKPAFLQPPVPEGTLEAFKSEGLGQSDLNLLVTAKNHDVKIVAGNTASSDSWAFALVALQTMQGYSGGGGRLNGIFRMNSGYGNRPGIGVRNGNDLGTHFRSDVAVLLEARSEVLRRGLYRDDGISLLWTVPWDGSGSMALNELDPWVVECCRRVRLTSHWATPACWTSPSAPKVKRVSVSDELAGNVGDPWTPVGRGAKNEGKAFSLPGTGFVYSRVVDLLLSPEWEPPPAHQTQTEVWGDARWYGRALVRGQGKTEGWHEREVPIPERLRSRFAAPDERDKLARAAQEMVKLAGIMRKDILRPALRALWDSEANSKRKEPSGTASAMIRQGLEKLESAIDGTFFDHLWTHPDDLDSWRERLAELARPILEDHCRRICPAVDRWRHIAKAERVFENQLHWRSHGGCGIFLPLHAKSADREPR